MLTKLTIRNFKRFDKVEIELGSPVVFMSALKTLGKGSPWSADIKASDDFLVPLFDAYFETLGLPNLVAKKNFYELAEHVPDSEIDPEISEKLDAIVRVAERATPAEE